MTTLAEEGAGKSDWRPPLAFSAEVSAMLASKGLQVRKLSKERLEDAVTIEQDAFPPDEMASRETMDMRRELAGDFFLEASLATATAEGVTTGANGDGVGLPGEMVAIMCSTRCRGAELTAESIHRHEADGETLCLHSVAVAEKHRRKGYATTFLKAYLEHVAVRHPGVRQVALMSKAKLLGMYASVGFSVIRISPVVLGKDPWFEMRLDFESREPRRLKYVQVDSFTDKVFGGNPAAVFFTHMGGDEAWMQKVASEMKLSETSFLELKAGEKGAEVGPEGPLYALRWFTPVVEVDLCGHATLAAAHALWEERVDRALPIRFTTRVGILTCRRDPEGGWVEMDFPSEPVHTVLNPSDEISLRLKTALGLTKGSDVELIGRNRWDMVVEVAPEVLEAIEPDMKLLASVECRGVLVTCKGERGEGEPAGTRNGSGVDFKSRFFAPRAGIDEDPVTGSAHACLAPYWSEKLGRNDALVGYQASKRGGTVRVKHLPDSVGNGTGRVLVSGKAITVSTGLFRRP